MSAPSCLIVYPDSFETFFDPRFQGQENTLLADDSVSLSLADYPHIVKTAQELWEQDFKEYLRSVLPKAHVERRENRLLGRSKDDWLYQVAPHVIRSEGVRYPLGAWDDWLASITAFARCADPVLFHDNYSRYLHGVLADSASVKY